MQTLDDTDIKFEVNKTKTLEVTVDDLLKWNSHCLVLSRFLGI